jgi:hypothetical protein
MDFWVSLLTWVGWEQCGSNACVQVDVGTTGDVKLTSTLGADKGEVVYTAEEWSVFIDRVKRGELDETVTVALAHA